MILLPLYLVIKYNLQYWYFDIKHRKLLMENNNE